MASSTIQNPPAPAESKSARKRKVKAAERTDSPARAASTPEKAASAAGDHDDLSDSPYIRELQKNIRNVNKKISNLAKTESVINEHTEKSLDELVALKIINADQKASHLKKPALQAQLAQLEEQLAQHKKIELEHRTRLAELEKSLTDKFEKSKASLVTEIKEQAAAEANATLENNLLVLSQFLRLAAARRAEGEDTSDEGQALEGVLWHIYTGDESAVAAMLKLVRGSDEQTVSTNGDKLETTFAKVKDLSVNYLANFYAEAAAEESETKESEPQPDPTVANAGLTEIEEGSAEALTNGHTAEPAATETAAPSNANVADNAANAAGESQWDAGNETANDLSMSQDWVEVKAPETEAVEAPPTKDSWADEHPETPAADPNDGFHPVQRNRGNREGGHRGRGERGGHRGRGGFRGDGRGRGRGRGGDRMPSRPRGNRGGNGNGNGNSGEAAGSVASAQSEYR